jgi:hypothetical protein
MKPWKGLLKMNDQQLEKKVRKDADSVKEDLSTLMGDSAVQLTRFEDRVSRVTDKAREDITSWMESGVSQVKDGFEKMTSDAREKVVDTTAAVKKDVNHGLSQYNAKAQELADKIPGGFSKKAAKYPWVAISIALIFGFLLGGLVKPGRHSLDWLRI